MTGLDSVRHGLHDAWDGLLEGWQHLARRATRAITRFVHRAEDSEGDGGAQRNSGWGVLAAEVFDDADGILVRLEAPGMDQADFDIEVLDAHLRISGEKKIERERSDGRYHVSERAFGRFERVMPLPTAVDAGAARASYANGVLRIELPRAKQSRRSVIKIESS